MASEARVASVKQRSKALPINSSRVRPVSPSMVWLTSVMVPPASVITSASTFESMSERV